MIFFLVENFARSRIRSRAGSSSTRRLEFLLQRGTENSNNSPPSVSITSRFAERDTEGYNKGHAIEVRSIEGYDYLQRLRPPPPPAARGATASDAESPRDLEIPSNSMPTIPIDDAARTRKKIKGYELFSVSVCVQWPEGRCIHDVPESALLILCYEIRENCHGFS